VGIWGFFDSLYDSNPATNGGNAGHFGGGNNSESFINNLNASNFGGSNDWRMPNPNELACIVNYDNNSPSINIDYFPNTKSGKYWSSTTGTGFVGSNEYAAAVYFTYGGGVLEYKSYNLYVRAVRGGKSFQNFIDNGDGTITDTSSGLMWQQRGSTTKMYWEDALIYCENLQLAGYNDWRLPNINELQYLVDYKQVTQPLINKDFFPDTFNDYYWSSTTSTSNKNFAFCLYFAHGNFVYSPKNELTRYVCAVRGPIYDLIQLSHFEASPQSWKIILLWSTDSEIDNAGFNIYRSESEDGEYIQINEDLIPAKGSPTEGSYYEFIDDDVKNRKTYYYKLEDMDLNGVSTTHGPVSATPRLIYGIRK